MSVEVTCGKCDATMRVSEDLLGRRIRCKSCGTAIVAEDDPVIDAATYEPPARTTRRRQRRQTSDSGSIAPVLWICGGTILGVGALGACIVGIVLLVRSATSIAAADGSSAASSNWVTITLPEGLTFNAPGQLAQVAASPLPGSKAYGNEFGNDVVAVLAIPTPAQMGNQESTILSQFESNIRQQMPQAKVRQLQVNGHAMAELDMRDPKTNIPVSMRVAVVGSHIVLVLVANKKGQNLAGVRDKLFQSMRVIGPGGTAMAGITQGPATGSAGFSGGDFNGFGSLFGSAPSTPTTPQATTIPGLAGGPPTMPAMPNMPQGMNPALPANPGQIPGASPPMMQPPNMPGGIPGAPGAMPGGIPGGPGAMPGAPGGIPRGLPGAAPGGMPGGIPGGGLGNMPGGIPGRPNGPGNPPGIPNRPGGIRPRTIPRR